MGMKVGKDKLYMIKDGEEILIGEINNWSFFTEDNPDEPNTLWKQEVITGSCSVKIDMGDIRAIVYDLVVDDYRLSCGRLPGSDRAKRLRKKRISEVNKWHDKNF